MPLVKGNMVEGKLEVMSLGLLDEEDVGDASLLDKYHYHEQLVASTEWLITHNFGRYATVSAFDSSNREVNGVVAHQDLDKTKVYFKYAMAGTAICT